MKYVIDFLQGLLIFLLVIIIAPFYFISEMGRLAGEGRDAEEIAKHGLVAIIYIVIILILWRIW